MGAVSQLHPPLCRWLVFGVEEKEKWNREDEYIWGRRWKGNFTLISLHDWCSLAKPVIFPWRIALPFLWQQWPIISSDSQLLPIWFPFGPYVQCESMNKYSRFYGKQTGMWWGSLSVSIGPSLAHRCLWHAGRQEKKHKDGRCVLCLSPCCHVWREHGDVLNKMSRVFFFPPLYHYSPSTVTENQIGAVVVSPSLCVDLLS